MSIKAAPSAVWHWKPSKNRRERAQCLFCPHINSYGAFSVDLWRDGFVCLSRFCHREARVHGAAIGGGVGLVAACDIAIASENARFGLSEVKLGLAPAVISPYVVRKIGETHARALFVTGQRFDAAHAKAIGLVHLVVSPERLDEILQDTLQELESSAPQAIRSCKSLALAIGKMNDEQARTYTSELIARLRVSEEGQEGLSAFLEKRRPRWQTLK